MKASELVENEIEFSSNTKMAQYFFQELIKDEKPHSSAEILAYVQQKSRGKGIDGKRLTDQTIRSAIWYGIRHKTADYEQIQKGVYQKINARWNPLNGDHPHKEAIYFLAEQARCLIQAGSADSEICRKGVEFLINGNADLTAWLNMRLNTQPFPDGSLEDYDILEYEGKDHDLDLAITNLKALAVNVDFIPEIRLYFSKPLKIISEFYGKNS